MTVAEQAERALARCRELAAISDVAGETTRLYLSPATRLAHDLLLEWMSEAGLDVSVDAVGNVRGFLAGPHEFARRVLLGSHIDTVVNAGAYDGVLGVLLALELVEAMREASLPFALEVLAFAEEEGVRFRKPFLGSLAAIGELPAEALELADHHGIEMYEAIEAFGLDPEQLALAEIDPGSVAYLELHIEQGPVLESEGRAIAAVAAIVGQTRMTLDFTGQANHAGTTPMHLRHDALAAAAAWVVAVEAIAKGTPGLVATVGSLDPKPGLGNVIAGAVQATLDLRHAVDEVRQVAVGRAIAAAEQEGAARGVTVTFATQIDQMAVPMSAQLTKLLVNSAKTAGYDATPVTSGAGHDALILARRVPAAMLFLRSPGGLSHHPQEAVLAGDVEAALETAMEFLGRLGDDVASGEFPCTS